MKKLFTFLAVFMAGMGLVLTTVYAKKADNDAGAMFIDWNLSGDVMPVPPYGSSDIIGSDTASKLILNHPQGRVVANLTGVMKGLNPNTVYTVYLSKTYTPYVPQTISPDWTWTVLNTYFHDIHLTTINPDGTFSGTGGYPSGANPYQTTEIIEGQLIGNTMTLKTTYNGPYNPGYSVTATGIVQADGSVIGTVPWSWFTSGGVVVPATGSTGWPGLLTGVKAFTFTTDEFGNGSWHYNFKDTIPADFASVWINGGGKTILISDPFEL
ncbi:MAG TPA: hypothetical protein PKU95_02490 [Candidatus Dojkabacteria bacterium]|nr:hypothetical protein [Candidatus Dojkabacteria bacterium]